MPHVYASRRRKWLYDQTGATSDQDVFTDPSGVAGLVAELQPPAEWLSGRGGSSTFNYWECDESGDNFVAYGNAKPTAGATFNSLASIEFTQGTKKHLYNGSAAGGTGDHLSIADWSYNGSAATGFFTIFMVLRDEGSTDNAERILFSSSSDDDSLPTDTGETGIWLTCTSPSAYASHQLAVKFALRAGSGSGASDLVQSTYAGLNASPFISGGDGTVLCFMRGARSIDGGSNWTQSIRLATFTNPNGVGADNWTMAAVDDSTLGSMTGGAKLFLGGVGYMIGGSTNLASGTEMAHMAMFSSESGDSDAILQYDVGDYKFAYAGCAAPGHGSADPVRSADLIGNFLKRTYALA